MSLQCYKPRPSGDNNRRSEGLCCTDAVQRMGAGTDWAIRRGHHAVDSLPGLLAVHVHALSAHVHSNKATCVR